MRYFSKTYPFNTLPKRDVVFSKYGLINSPLLSERTTWYNKIHSRQTENALNFAV